MIAKVVELDTYKQTNMMIVAMSLVGANIRFIWFTGPIRKRVLDKATTFPRLYKTAKMT